MSLDFLKEKFHPLMTTAATLRSLKFWAVLRNISGRFTFLAQYALNNFRRRPQLGTALVLGKMRAGAAHGVDGRSEYNNADSAGANTLRRPSA